MTVCEVCGDTVVKLHMAGGSIMWVHARPGEPWNHAAVPTPKVGPWKDGA